MTQAKTITNSAKKNCASKRDSKRPVLFSCFATAPIDRVSIPQSDLDIANRVRTNLFPWRGQFSPQLVEILISKYASKGDIILDPFVGVGTTIYEAARHGFSAVATEINPAAYEMANTCIFINKSLKQRKSIISQAGDLLSRPVANCMPLFSQSGNEGSLTEALVNLVGTHSEDHFLKNLFINTLIRFLNTKTSKSSETILKCFNQHTDIILALPYSTHPYEIHLVDARDIPIDNGTIDLIITSPPYINVFNYHQNNRSAMELFGWDILQVAKSEFGSNRKNRGNRLLTVVQYCLDMAEAFGELARVAKSDAKLILVVGRESNVRKIAFQNGAILAEIGTISGFTLESRQERKFTNKFGAIICEDILHFSPRFQSNPPKLETVRELAVEILRDAKSRTADKSILADIHSAIDSVSNVTASPIYSVTTGGL